MSLDLSPQSASLLEQEANRTGVSVDTLIERTFAPRRAAPVDNPMLQLLQTRLREAENTTPEEIAQADVEHRQWQENMNENRRVNGERLLFPEIPQS